MQLESKDQTIEIIDELIEQYKSLDDYKLDAMAKQDVSMKITSLKSVKKDIERFT
jgi:hypothetical protein